MASPATAARSLVAAALIGVALGAAPARAAGPDSLAAPVQAADSLTAAPDSIAPADSLPGPSPAVTAPAPAADSLAPPPPAPVATPVPGPAATPADWDTLYAGLPEQVVLTYGPRLAYERVDGPFVGGDIGFKRREDDRPLMQVWLGYAFSRKRGLGGASAEIPLGYRGVLHVGGSVYRRTASEDAWIVGGTENTFFALFARTDYRDWFEAEGGEAHAAWDPGRDVAVRLTARVETQRSLSTRTRFSLFGKDDRFRPNPPIEDGVLGVWSATARIGPERIPSGGGTNGSLTFERAGDPVARDFTYTRLGAEARTTVRLAPAHTVRARVIAGSTRDGTLPSQMLWQVGGIGTLRALDYKVFEGDQFFVANAEYYVLARKNLYPMAFVDWGAAWFGRGNLSRQQPGIDAGVGLRLGEGPILFTLGRDLRRSGAPLRFGVRLGGSF